MATSSISSATAWAACRCATPWPRPAPSSPCRQRRHRARPTRTIPARQRAASGSAARTINGTHAEAYLRARAIHRCRFSALRFHPALFYRDGGGVRRLPALVAAITANAEEHSRPAERPGHAAIVGVHRTWLDPRQPAKAAVSFPRKTLGRVHGHAVRFGDNDAGTLAVGEGIETVLSLVTAVPAITAAAALSAGGLGAFTPPAGIARLVVACDNDAAGESAALRLRRRCAAMGVDCTVVVSQGRRLQRGSRDTRPAGPGRTYRASDRHRCGGGRGQERNRGGRA